MRAVKLAGPAILTLDDPGMSTDDAGVLQGTRPRRATHVSRSIKKIKDGLDLKQSAVSQNLVGNQPVLPLTGIPLQDMDDDEEVWSGLIPLSPDPPLSLLPPGFQRPIFLNEGARQSIPLHNFSWFKGDITEDVVNAVLAAVPLGHFVVTLREESYVQFILYVRLRRKNIPFEIIPHVFDGETVEYTLQCQGEFSFPSVPHLIRHFATIPLPDIQNVCLLCIDGLTPTHLRQRRTSSFRSKQRRRLSFHYPALVEVNSSESAGEEDQIPRAGEEDQVPRAGEEDQVPSSIYRFICLIVFISVSLIYIFIYIYIYIYVCVCVCVRVCVCIIRYPPPVVVVFRLYRQYNMETCSPRASLCRLALVAFPPTRIARLCIQVTNVTMYWKIQLTVY